ncbi:MAG: hypothetical protein JWN48_874 [Myxococcaceae bacterium]|nr:hypothetical protein [Myxococcaceae bacterium]
MEAHELKRRLAQGRSRGRNGYEPELREAVLAYAARRKAEGASQKRVAAELAMSEQTLCYWRALARQRGGLSRVAIIAEPAVACEVIVECGPLRVRGLDIGGVAELLRKLG